MKQPNAHQCDIPNCERTWLRTPDKEDTCFLCGKECCSVHRESFGFVMGHNRVFLRFREILCETCSKLLGSFESKRDRKYKRKLQDLREQIYKEHGGRAGNATSRPQIPPGMTEGNWDELFQQQWDKRKTQIETEEPSAELWKRLLLSSRDFVLEEIRFEKEQDRKREEYLKKQKETSNAH